MDADTLRALQGPLKTRYREEPEAARWTLEASGTVVQETASCRVETHVGSVDAGLHPAAGGDGRWACSAGMLLESLVGCAGVTLSAVASAIGITLRSARIRAEGDLDFRGTLGVHRDTDVGLTAIRLIFELDSDASEEQKVKLVELTERYCVVLQTLRKPPQVVALIQASES